MRVRAAVASTPIVPQSMTRIILTLTTVLLLLLGLINSKLDISLSQVEVEDLAPSQVVNDEIRVNEVGPRQLRRQALREPATFGPLAVASRPATPTSYVPKQDIPCSCQSAPPLIRAPPVRQSLA